MTLLSFFLTFVLVQPPGEKPANPAAGDNPAKEPAATNTATAIQEPQTRFEVLPLIKLYPQTTPKQTLESVINAAEKGRFDYVVAQLADPDYVNNECMNRATSQIADVERNIRMAKAKGQTEFAGRRLPVDPSKLQPIINDVASQIGFNKLVADMNLLYSENPGMFKELRKFLRDGEVQENGERAKIVLKEFKSKAVMLTKLNNRWFLQNEQSEKAEKAEKASEKRATLRMDNADF